MQHRKVKMKKADIGAVHQKNEILTVRIEDIGENGEGIGRAEGYTLFVKDAVIGDLAKVKIMKTKKHYGFAKLLTIEEASPDRVEPRCPISRQCGGCQIQALSYPQQLAFKQKKVRDDLVRIGGFPEDYIDSIMEPIVGMEEPWRYRNKAQVPVGERDGELIAGFYAGHTHVIVPMTDCLIGAEENQRILQTVLTYMQENHVTCYHEETGKGMIRHILIRTGVYSGQVMVCIIANVDKLPHEEILVQMLKELPGICSISLNTNRERTNVILGKKLRTLWGQDRIEDSLHILQTGEEVRFQISPLSFYQVNPRQTEKLYSLALSYAGLTGKEVVWDVYCGIGTISLFLARHAGSVYGVEVVPEAIEDARANAALNGITNVQFETGKAEEVLPAYCERRRAAGVDTPVDVVVVDPPRKGCDPVCLETILSVAPASIVYVSCDPATLARDTAILRGGGYKLEKVTPVDQFGHTTHVETVCLLSKLHEAKQKNGIFERENYNKPKSETAKQPQCPDEKEAAIVEALKHFGMVQ